MATLLLADDSLTTQKVVNLTFVDEGIEVITAEDGDTALQLFHERQPDVVLADVNMPGLNGYEVCEEIRKTNDSQKTPVVLLVGSFEPFDAEAAYRVGANDYLTKPFSSIRRLVATVLSYLEESPTAEQASSTVDAIEEITVEPAFSEQETQEFEQPSFEEVSEAPEPVKDEDQAPEAELVESESSVARMSEPDMYATNDIDELYLQSVPEKGETPPMVDENAQFAETIEMPHMTADEAQLAETVEIPHAVAEKAQFDDGSLDDELIEATYSELPPVAAERQQAAEPEEGELQASDETPKQEEFQTSEWEETPRTEMPLEQPEPAAFEPAISIGEEPAEVSQDLEDTSEIKVETEQETAPFEAPVYETDSPVQELADSNTAGDGEAVQDVNAEDAPTEEYNFEYRSEETYFEPAAAEPALEPSPIVEELQTLASTNRTEGQHEEARVDFIEQHAEPAVETAEPQSQEEPQLPTSTPWDSVATASREFSFDESNLLELPADSKEYTENSSGTASQLPADGLSIETVERITRIVASQMSEQLIREIAERVVPMVVEETMARRAREEVNN